MKMKYKLEISLSIIGILIGLAATFLAWRYPFNENGGLQEQVNKNEIYVRFFEAMNNAERERTRIDLLNSTGGNVGDINFSQLVDVVALFELENNRLHAFKTLYKPEIKIEEDQLNRLRGTFSLEKSNQIISKHLMDRSVRE